LRPSGGGRGELGGSGWVGIGIEVEVEVEVEVERQLGAGGGWRAPVESPLSPPRDRAKVAIFKKAGLARVVLFPRA
jgi:hypothetical protein